MALLINGDKKSDSQGSLWVSASRLRLETLEEMTDLTSKTPWELQNKLDLVEDDLNRSFHAVGYTVV